MSWLKSVLKLIPNQYLAFDCETSGFDPKDDLIVELGYCYVEQRKPVKRLTRVLDWTRSEFVDQEWLAYKLDKCRQQMAEQRMTYCMTMDRMRKEGRPPADVLQDCVARIKAVRNVKQPIVGHGLIHFDRSRLSQATEEWLGRRFELPLHAILDTGAIAKAIMMGLAPHPGEKTWDFFKRAFHAKQSGLKWNLAHCAELYELNTKYGLDFDKLHGAEMDAFASHCLLEELRKAGK